MTHYIFYKPGETEKLREWERACRAAGIIPRILTNRSALNTRLTRKYGNIAGAQTLLALHAAGGGVLCSLNGADAFKWSKAAIERLLEAYADSESKRHSARRS